MANELKPCPFCGETKYLEVNEDEQHSASVVCTECCVRGTRFMARAISCWDIPDAWERASSKAIAAWNTRAERTCRNIATLNRDGVSDYFFSCSNCGLDIEAFSGIKVLDYTDESRSGFCVGAEYHFDHCPNCGARVVEGVE